MQRNTVEVTLKYDRGTRKEDISTIDVLKEELEQMVENDYQLRLARAAEGEIVQRQTVQEFFERMNRDERNSWQTHNRHQHQYPITFESDEEDEMDLDLMDMFADHSQAEARKRQEDYEEQCQLIRMSNLKPEQIEMLIAICLDKMLVKDYANKISDEPKNVSKRFMRAKSDFKKFFATNKN